MGAGWGHVSSPASWKPEVQHGAFSPKILHFKEDFESRVALWGLVPRALPAAGMSRLHPHRDLPLRPPFAARVSPRPSPSPAPEGVPPAFSPPGPELDPVPEQEPRLEPHRLGPANRLSILLPGSPWFYVSRGSVASRLGV